MLACGWRVAAAHGLRKAAAAVLKPRLIRSSFQPLHLIFNVPTKICTTRTFCSASTASAEAAEEGNIRDYAYYIKILRHTAKHRLHDEAFQILDYMQNDEGISLYV